MDIQLDITQNGMNGEGIAKLNGKVFFVQDAVAGDIVLANITKQNKNFSLAQTKQIIKSSEFRCIPKCQYYGTCGGCNLQHINYQEQLKIKTQNVQNLFDKNKLDFKVSDCISSQNIYEYRNKLTLYLSLNNQLAFYQKNSKNLIDINNCCLVDKNFNNLIQKLNIFLKNNKDFNRFVLKGLAVRQVGQTFIINLILNKKLNLTKLESFLKLNKINYSLFYCVNNKTNLPMYPCIFVGGEKQIICSEFGIKYNIEPMSFLQINNYIKSQIYNKIFEKVNGKKVLDAYSGAGLLSAMLSKKCEQVFAIEIDESACKSCYNLCKTNNIKNLKCICGDCSVELPKLVKQVSLDCIILDPARKGVDEASLMAIKSVMPSEIIYLSCNPATISRDLKILCADNNYTITYAQPYDMFPQTSEVETLVFLSRK